MGSVAQQSLTVTDEQVVSDSYHDVSQYWIKFFLRKNFSKVVLGAVLSQRYKIEVEKSYMPVLCACRFLKKSKRIYVTDLNMFAVFLAVKEFKY